MQSQPAAAANPARTRTRHRFTRGRRAGHCILAAGYCDDCYCAWQSSKSNFELSIRPWDINRCCQRQRHLSPVRARWLGSAQEHASCILLDHFLQLRFVRADRLVDLGPILPDLCGGGGSRSRRQIMAARRETPAGSAAAARCIAKPICAGILSPARSKKNLAHLRWSRTAASAVTSNGFAFRAADPNGAADLESWHRGHAALLGNVVQVVDIDLRTHRCCQRACNPGASSHVLRLGHVRPVASCLTLTQVTDSYLPERDSKIGPIRLHGPHLQKAGGPVGRRRGVGRSEQGGREQRAGC